MLRGRSILAWQLLIGCHSASSTAPESPATTSPSSTTSPRAPTPTPSAPSPSATAATPVRATATATDPPAPPSTFIVRYVCDDKYDEGSVCRPGTPAWDAWLATVQLSTAAPNLLKHEGGGPSGAEWNPEAPLVAFVANAEVGSARLKSSKTIFAPVARFRDYDVFLVPKSAWNAAVRAARAGDFPAGSDVAPISVVELSALGGKVELARGTFAFSRGE